jgi:hypothetical protein
MNEDSLKRLEQHSRALFQASVERVDMRVQSRLNRARQVALATTPARFAVRPRLWAPAFGAVAALVLGIAIWRPHGSVDAPPTLSSTHSGYEDLDIVASNDSLDLLQDDIEFYDWVDASAPAGAGSAGVG